MRNRSCFIALALASTMAAGAAAAPRPDDSAPAPLYQIEKAAPPALAEPLVFDAAEELLIQVDPRVVARNPRTLLIDLPGQPMLEAVRTRFDVYEADWKSWFGTLRPVDDESGPTGYIYLGFHGDRLTSDMTIAGERYRIVGGPGVGQRLVRLSAELTPPSCGLGAEADAADGEEPSRPHWRTPEESPEVGSFEEKDLQEKDPVPTRTVDVLFVYPARLSTLPGARPTFFQFDGSQAVRYFAQDSIATANAIFTNSSVDARYGLLGVVPLIDAVEWNGAPVNGLQAMVAWLTGGAGNSPPRAPEPAALREAYGADIVAALIPPGWDATNACGYANLPQIGRFQTGVGTIQEDMGDRAFSATRSGCGGGDFTVPHEIGHNHGLRHNVTTQEPIDAADIYPYGRGYVFPVNGETRATVMGCHRIPGDIFGTVCNRIPHFSNPSILWPPNSPTAVPTGTPPNGNDPGRNEALAMLNRVFTTERYRTRSTNVAPSARMTVSCSGLNCTFSASGSSDNTYIADYYWDLGDGTTARGFNANRTYTTAGFRRIHLVVTDSQGQRTVTTGSASPWNPAYEGYVDQINCRTINGWAYDAVVPNASINVDVYRNGSKAATVPANIFRQDLVNAGKGNGYHGFNYTPSSSWRNGQWQTAGVRFPNTSTDLIYLAERTIICNVGMFTGITPTENLATGGQVYSVATQLSSSKSGLITQIGFHRASGETGSNTLHLTTDGGADLTTPRTASCTGAGWCWVTLNPAVAINQGTRYRVWVNTNTQQSKTGCGIGGGLSNGPLTAHSGFWVAGNTFPTNGSCSNFFVDVKFEM
jgi:hypothetical protein